MPGSISIVAPAYNQAEYLAACLDSLWFQEHGQLEIIVVNDGSTDETARVLEGYLARLPEDSVSYASRYDEASDVIERVHHKRYREQGRSIKVVTHEVNKGLAAALNTGMRAATGDYVTYVPTDDTCYPHMFTELAAPLDAGRADFTYADMHIVSAEGGILRCFALPDYSFERCFADWYLCGVAKLYRRELHDTVGWYDEGLLAHDHELFQRFALSGARFEHVARPLMALLDHEQGRQKDIHDPANWSRLLNESRALVRQAREHLRKQEGKQGGEDAKTDGPLRLHIGGTQVKDGWRILNIQPGPHVDFTGDCTDLSRFADGSVEEIYACHVVEHLDFATNLLPALKEMHRVLAPGGTARISVPDMEILARMYVRDGIDMHGRAHLMHILFGGHTDAHDYHQTGFDFDLLSHYLREAGFVSVERVEPFGMFDDYSDYAVDGTPISINAVAVKG